MRLLITGGSGFVGTTAREYFNHARYEGEENFEVLSVDRVPSREAFSNCKDYVGNLRDRDQLFQAFDEFRPNIVLHLAAQARVEPSLQDPIGTYRDNVEATINVLEGAFHYGVKRLVYASSEAIYGQADHYPTKENQHFRPISPYAASKIAADVMVQQFHPIETVVVRSGMGFGPRSPPEQVITKFMLRCMQDKPLLFPAGPVIHPTRDCNYIQNWMDGIHRIIEKEHPSKVYNLGSGQEFSLLDIARAVISVVGTDHQNYLHQQIVFDPEFKYRPGEEGMRTFLDITRAQTELGYSPKVNLLKGLFLTFEWLQSHTNYWD